MNTVSPIPTFTDPEVLADLDAVLAGIAAGKPIERKTLQRIRERSDRITEELRQKHGELDVAVDLIREIRDEV